MNEEKARKNDIGLTVIMILIGLIIAIGVIFFISTQGSNPDFAAAAANAQKPLGTAFGDLLNKYF